MLNKELFFILCYEDEDDISGCGSDWDSTDDDEW